MKKISFSNRQKEFLAKIIMIDFGLLLLGSIIALSLKLNFGMIIFILGLLSTVIGGYLGSPGQYYPNNIRIRDINFFKQPSPEELRDQMMHDVKNSVPFYAHENILLFAGVIAVLIGLLFLF